MSLENNQRYFVVIAITGVVVILVGLVGTIWLYDRRIVASEMHAKSVFDGMGCFADVHRSKDIMCNMLSRFDSKSGYRVAYIATDGRKHVLEPPDWFLESRGTEERTAFPRNEAFASAFKGLYKCQRNLPFSRIDFNGSDFSNSDFDKLIGFKVYSFALAGTSIDDSARANFRRFKIIREINLSYTKIGTPTVRELSDFQDLTGIELEGCKAVNDETMFWIGKMNRIERINLRDTKVTDEGLAQIFPMKQELDSLNVSNTEITEDALVKFCSRVRVNNLYVRGLEISSENRQRLKGIVTGWIVEK